MVGVKINRLWQREEPHFSKKNLRQRRKCMDMICRFLYTAIIFKSNPICKL